ncbi:hypothetical protein GLAREA_12783 [Glarea lozoyensis ATCC 20868]|uniref:DUF2306 domain-containing protein n=1 Tax=Glarea lozoyensis (strain ATCC 20868 / MF5171) TaxID=1116229 RepID=S3CWM6_GLAL2|nr:uncharacterized protein GLAREA_12783 [Glarea lozoyensis ATCC 20868]EPE30060.1 hypothetical protein GLAREA_12783 [Glarea lozoyensis ATCC 20868]
MSSTTTEIEPKGLEATSSAEAEKSIPQNSTKAPNKFVSAMRRIYRPLGFQKGYNFPLFIIFAGAMLGFCLARAMYMNVSGNAPHSFKNSTVPGEWYWYQKGFRKIGITLHLATCIPLGFLMIWQFVPVIRHKFLMFHRINGYVVIILTFLTNVGALMIGRHSFGGGPEIQLGVGVLAIVTIGSICMAYYNVKRLQIDQHRAWMLRGMFYLGTIITLRIIMQASTPILSASGNYFQSQPCKQVQFSYELYGFGPYTQMLYPQCSDPNAQVSVKASMEGPGPENIEAALGISFGMAFWMALFLHMIGPEIYLSLTPAEGERLRNVSYERQLEAGFKNPGSSGLTSDRWGDAPEWKPQVV